MASKGKKRSGKGPTETVANSMTPHLTMHSTRGVESGRGRREVKKQKDKYQKTVYGKQVLPPDEATPFFTTYVLHYAFPTIAIICTCLGCILLRTMKMYQKERWKGTSYFHGEVLGSIVMLSPQELARASCHFCVAASQRVCARKALGDCLPLKATWNALCRLGSAGGEDTDPCDEDMSTGARRSAESLLPGLK